MGAGQLTIDFTAPVARATDPHTSFAAAQLAAVNASGGRIAALRGLVSRPRTDFELADVTGLQQTSVGKRRLECQRAGLVEPHRNDAGDQVRRSTPSGSMALVWQITDKGRAFLAGVAA